MPMQPAMTAFLPKFFPIKNTSSIYFYIYEVFLFSITLFWEFDAHPNTGSSTFDKFRHSSSSRLFSDFSDNYDNHQCAGRGHERGYEQHEVCVAHIQHNTAQNR